MVEQVEPEVRAQPPQPQQVPRAITPGLKPASERFMKRNPQVLEGTVDPGVVEECISMIKKIFEFVQIEDVDRVKCAVYMLRKDTRIWWDIVKKTQDVATKFLIEFNSKY